jgi:uncharacterized membrane protein YfcA
MAEVLPWLLLAVVAFTASTVAAVTGFGGAVLLLPFVVAVFGIRDAVPVLTVAQLLGNSGRVWVNRKEISPAVVGWYSLGAVPAALLGGLLFAVAPLADLTRLLGLFLVVMALVWHFREGSFPRLTRPGFAPLGAGASFVSALVGSSGPLVAPFFVAHGLVKGAYVGTEALCAVVTHGAKLAAYGHSSLLTGATLAGGLPLGLVMVAGAYAGKRVMARLPERAFVLLVKGMLLAVGVVFAIRGA